MDILLPNEIEIPDLDFILPPEIDKLSPESKILALLALGKAGLGIQDLESFRKEKNTKIFPAKSQKKKKRLDPQNFGFSAGSTIRSEGTSHKQDLIQS